MQQDNTPHEAEMDRQVQQITEEFSVSGRSSERPAGEDTLNDILGMIDRKKSAAAVPEAEAAKTVPTAPAPAPEAATEALKAAPAAEEAEGGEDAEGRAPVKVDERFRRFFSKSVVVIPEDVHRAEPQDEGPDDEDDEEEDPSGGFFGWLSRLFGRGSKKPTPAHSNDILLPPGAGSQPTVYQPMKTAPKTESPSDETQQIDLTLQSAPERQLTDDLTGEIQLEQLDEPTGEQPASTQGGRGVLFVPPETAAPKKEPATSDPAAQLTPEETAGLYSLEAVLMEFGTTPVTPPAPEPVFEMPEPETKPDTPAPAGSGSAPQPKPEQPATGEVSLGQEEPSTGEVSLGQEEPTTGEVSLGQEEPSTGEVPLGQEEPPTGEVPLGQEEPATGEVSLGQEKPATGEVSLGQEEPATGEVSLGQEEPATGEIPLSEDSMATGEIPLGVDGTATGEIPLGGKIPGDVTSHKADDAALHLFGDEEPSEEDLAEEGPAPVAKDYESPDDARSVAAGLAGTVSRLTLRCILTGVATLAMLLLPVSPLDPELAPSTYLGVMLGLLGFAALVSLPVLRDGLVGLFGKPSPDTMPALAAVAAAVQLIVCLSQSALFDPLKITLFAPAAGLLLFGAALGSRCMAAVVKDNFTLISNGVEHSAAYRLKDKNLAAELAAGLQESHPVLLLSRPAAVLQGFLAHSFSQRQSDARAQRLARILLATGVVCALLALILGGSPLDIASVLAGAVCLGAPLSSTLLAAVPSLLMHRSASRVGAVVPGWCDVEQMGRVNLVQVDARDLFAPSCAHLYGIKTYSKERIDLAILYATSVLIEGCDTLEGLFRSMIENKTDMLYEVRDLKKHPGRGFTAWCDNCRVAIGTRAMMQQEGIPLPAMDSENRYSKDGQRHVLYLAVSGQLYAMFLFGYEGESNIAGSLASLRKAGIRLLVTAEDPTLTAERIEDIYKLERGFVKILSAQEARDLRPATAYLPASEGCMVHLGSFTSFVGGLRAAAGGADAENASCLIQLASVLASVAASLFLTATHGMAGLQLFGVLLYQISWCGLTCALPLLKKY